LTPRRSTLTIVTPNPLITQWPRRSYILQGIDQTSFPLRRTLGALATIAGVVLIIVRSRLPETPAAGAQSPSASQGET